MFKRIITTMLAADFAFGALTCGIQKAEERTLETMSAIEQRIDEIKPESTTKTAQTTKVSNPYLKQKLGTFYITFYVPGGKWGRATSTGEEPIHLRTCAVDPKLIPYGSSLLVIGQNGQQLILRANDCGKFGGKQLDIFWDKSVDEGYSYFEDFGEYATVYLLEE